MCSYAFICFIFIADHLRKKVERRETLKIRNWNCSLNCRLPNKCAEKIVQISYWTKENNEDELWKQNETRQPITATYKSRANFIRFGNEYINLSFSFSSGSSHVTDISLLLFSPPASASCRLLFNTKALTPRLLCLQQAYYHSGNTSDSHSEDIWLESRNVLLLTTCVPFQKKARASCPNQATKLLPHIVLHLLPVYYTRY
jgi:hypothetical protein